MQAKGIPADVIHNFIKTYGMGRINQAKLQWDSSKIMGCPMTHLEL